MNLPEDLLAGWLVPLRIASEVAAKTGSVIYMVGGPVRDLLRGVVLDDLDLAVERNEEVFASKLAEALEGRLTANQAFMTWTLLVDGGRSVDLARLRTETYARPGALPVVRPASSIEEDLARRDFTLNAMAFRLDENRIIDPFGGRTDLKQGRLRVLHDASFIDDPTRVFRALRIASRCTLELEPETSGLLDAAIRSGALDTISRERAWKEIDLACREARPVPVVRALADRKCLEPFLGIAGSGGVAHLPDDLVIPNKIDARVVLLGALMRFSSDVNGMFLPYEKSIRARIRSIATRSPSLAEILSHEERSDDNFDACDSASIEERFLAGAEVDTIAEILRRFDAASAAAVAIRGDRLGVPPGPWIGRAIRETRRALFATRIAESDAFVFARRTAMKYLND